MKKIKRAVRSGLIGLLSLGVASSALAKDITPKDLALKTLKGTEYRMEMSDGYTIDDFASRWTTKEYENNNCRLNLFAMEKKRVPSGDDYTSELSSSLECNLNGKSHIIFNDENSDGIGAGDRVFISHEYPNGNNFNVEMNIGREGSARVSACVSSGDKHVCGYASEDQVPGYMKWRFDSLRSRAIEAFTGLYNTFVNSAYNGRILYGLEQSIGRAAEESKPLVDSLLDDNDNAVNAAIDLVKVYEISLRNTSN